MIIKPGDQFQGLFSNLIHTVISITSSYVKVAVQDYINLVEYKTTKQNLIKYKRKIN